MLYAGNVENMKLYEEGNLKPVSIKIGGEAEEYYSLNDKFHQHSKKKSFVSFARNLSMCRNLSAKVNSSAAEQANAIMSKDRFVILNRYEIVIRKTLQCNSCCI